MLPLLGRQGAAASGGMAEATGAVEGLQQLVLLALLLSDVTKIFLFRSRLRFSTLPSLSMFISLCLADAN